MDAGSILVLAIVLALFVAVVVYLVRRSRRGGGCGDCSEEGCAFHGTDHEPTPGATLADGSPATCPSIQRALRNVDELLDAKTQAAERGASAPAPNAGEGLRPGAR